MKKKNIALIFGGYSTEYYASCVSAANILKNFDEDMFNIIKIGITLKGEWFLTEAKSHEIDDGKKWVECNNKACVVDLTRNSGEIIIFNESSFDKIKIDCVFLITHGYRGEDGSIQGVLEVANIPYVGCGVLASASGMDKQITKVFVDSTNVKRPKSIDLLKEDYKYGKKLNIEFSYPIFVKPANGGSSVGITKVENEATLHEAIMTAFDFDNKIIIEEGVQGRELSIAIVGNDELEFGEICEIITPEKKPFSYETKYINPIAQMKIPADIDEITLKNIKEMAKTIYKSIGCEIWARIDLFLDNNNEVYFNEINTIPAFTSHSIVPLSFQKKGIESTMLINKLIDLAYERAKRRKTLDIESVESIL